jgi:uncharacterized membrane protein YkvA (DUF1232 family)
MSSSPLDALVSDAPPELRASVERMLQRPVASPQTILSELDAYNRRIDDAVRVRPDLDVHLAESILRACRSLLEDAWRDLGGDQRRLVQLACDYYLDPEDEDGDLQSVFGFDDDAVVLNLVLDALDRSDLKVQI